MSLTFRDTFPAAPFGYVLDWNNHPRFGRLSGPQRLTLNMRRYDFSRVSVDLVSQTPQYVSRCAQGFFNYNLTANESALLADNNESMFPVHLRFSTPLRDVGAYVSADAHTGSAYSHQVAVLLDGETDWQIFARTSVLSTRRGSAPFLSALTNDGPGIVGLGFDVVNLPGATLDVTQVAIGLLHFNL